MEKLKDIEKKMKAPINPNDSDFKKLDFTWLHEPGLHFGFDTEEMAIAFVVRIRSLVNISGDEIGPILESMSIIMDWTFAVNEIKVNAASQPVHGINATKSTQGNGPEGEMFCAGWRNSFGAGEQFAAYAAKDSDSCRVEYARLRPKLPVVGKAFMEGFSSLYPGGYQSMRETALSEGTPSFADTDFVDKPGAKSLVPFGISLAITREDFSNYLHTDRDYTADAYGWWWPAQWDNQSKRYVFNEKVSHQDIKGGCFIWGDYGFGVDFERCEGLVEIYWRGKTDYHGTLKSVSKSGATRFGTSTQLTEKGVRGFQSWLNNGKLRTGIKTFQDRMNPPAKKGKETERKGTGKST
ncbi:hypothetical protein CPB83DRAFT_854378 [Crepidotus variabilis]|uniref:Tet-like 2OG-Fe(II) oxygenase domain-containing protein n=1 Tax=Crepidotus variabilis TaxID=179855 RepID=A0A9P6JQH1_9AGAR|nr:hypothetical protein CPB83DRAFT_854378 [Crepidotus variabilis]